MNDFRIVIHGYCIHFFDSVVFIGLQCPIPNAPCNFQRLLHKQLCLLELFQQGSRPFQGVPMHFVGWTPPPMLESQWCPKILEAKCTNKGRLTHSICCAWAWSSSDSNFAFFFTLPKAFFSFRFCLACGLLKIRTFITWWFYCLGPPTRIEGQPNLPTPMWSPCLLSKCWRSSHLAA
jgi:hypothetical protein